MTTIIRSNVTLSAPRPGSMLLPSLGVAGVTHRWHAETVTGKPGSDVSVVPDSVGSADLSNVAYTVTLGEAPSGRRYIDLGAGTGDGNLQNRILGPTSGDSNEEFTLAGLVYWEKSTAPGTSYGILNTSGGSTQAVSLDAGNNRISAYGGGGGSLILSTAPSARVGWHTAVVTYRKNGDEAISLDGGAVAKGDVHNVNAATSINYFGMSGRPEHKVRVIDYAFINRALSDAEHAKLHAALATQIPS